MAEEKLTERYPNRIVPAVQDTALKNFTVLKPDFTGVARSVECYDNQGNSNFRILTLYIEKGKVVKMDVSDPFAQFEAIQKLDHHNDLAVINLNINWQEGKTLSK